MTAVLLLALVAVAAAVVVIVYAAYPYRGQDTPLAPRVGRAMRRGVAALPTVDPADPVDDPRADPRRKLTHR